MSVQKLTHWKKFYNNTYLGTWSLPDGKDIILTITKVVREDVVGQGGRKEQLPVLYFKEADKGLVLNKTNGKTIEKLYSPFVENWTGKRIQLFAKNDIKIGNGRNAETTDGLRIRPMIPANVGESQKVAIKKQIIEALESYTQPDKEDIIKELKAKKLAKEDTIEYLNNQLKLVQSNGKIAA